MPDDAATQAVIGADPVAGTIWDAVLRAALAAGPCTVKPARSQIGLWRAHPFAAVWRPGAHLHGPQPPLVLTIFARARIPSPRWKEVVEPAPGRFTHHLPLTSPDQVDEEVARWLSLAATAAT